jgi:hypothetical protein
MCPFSVQVYERVSSKEGFKGIDETRYKRDSIGSIANIQSQSRLGASFGVQYRRSKSQSVAERSRQHDVVNSLPEYYLVKPIFRRTIETILAASGT